MADGSFSPAPRDIHARSVSFDFSKVPRHWLGGSVVATHVANGVNLLFPAGERFFVRSVHRYMNRVTDPALRAQIKGFFGQEGRHAKEHERFFEILTAQGYDIARFGRLYEKVAFGFIERLAPPELSLATTAACEHFTALLAENALRLRILDEIADPSMRALLLWHSAEEIEHRAVAFDVLQQVNASYSLRVAGLAMAASLLSGFWVLGTLSLLAQEDASARELYADWRKVKRFSESRGERAVFLRGMRQYLGRDFHPLQDASLDALARDYLAGEGLA
jgi:hypothetical protein